MFLFIFKPDYDISIQLFLPAFLVHFLEVFIPFDIVFRSYFLSKTRDIDYILCLW